jgi:site-specific DNA-methyltransferase (adenine-specific)
VLTSCQPFTTKLISSNPKMFKYCWYWYKNMVTGFANAKKQPLRCVEEVCIFYKHQPTYNPQGIIVLDKPILSRGQPGREDSVYKVNALGKDTYTTVMHYPRQVLEVKCQREGLHPTQKPVRLLRQLIEIFTDPGDIVIDPVAGSGSTLRAAYETGRSCYGFEVSRDFCELDRKTMLNGILGETAVKLKQEFEQLKII